jgi:hypothetical protein
VPRRERSQSNIAIYGAIAANVAIAVTKFAVAGITGSSAMLSEGIHSAVDTFSRGGVVATALEPAGLDARAGRSAVEAPLGGGSGWNGSTVACAVEQTGRLDAPITLVMHQHTRT